MAKRNIWAYLFFVSLIVSAFLSFSLFQKHSEENAKAYKGKYTQLKTSYIQIAKQQAFLFDTLLKNSDLYKLIPEYKDMTKEKFDEQIRRKIVELNIKAETLENEK